MQFCPPRCFHRPKSSRALSCHPKMVAIASGPCKVALELRKGGCCEEQSRIAAARGACWVAGLVRQITHFTQIFGRCRERSRRARKFFRRKAHLSFRRAHVVLATTVHISFSHTNPPYSRLACPPPAQPASSSHQPILCVERIRIRVSRLSVQDRLSGRRKTSHASSFSSTGFGATAARCDALGVTCFELFCFPGLSPRARAM